MSKSTLGNTKSKRLIVAFALLLFILGLFIFRHDISSYLYLRHCIIWNENAQVRYDDFQKDPNYDSGMDMHFSHELELKSSPFTDARVVAVFNKNESWVKDTTNYDFYELLVMQKVAFDLTECYARKFNAEIKRKGYDTDGTQKSFSELEKIGDSIYSEFRTVEDEILRDKNRNVTQLIEYWRPKVDKMLEEKDNYH